MEINIEIKSVDIQNKGKYKIAEVAYEDKGVPKNKKVMSFGKSEQAFLALANKPTGPYKVTLEKDGEYWNWVAVEKGTAQPASSGGAAPASGGSRSFESQEEREAKQRYIVRQSSLSNAIQTLSVNPGKEKISVDDVIGLATTYEQFVFGEYAPALSDEFSKDIAY